MIQNYYHLIKSFITMSSVMRFQYDNFLAINTLMVIFLTENIIFGDFSPEIQKNRKKKAIFFCVYLSEKKS